MGYGCSLTTPVQVRGRLWGAISVASVAPDSLPADAERVLDDFAELIGLAVANTEAHAVLMEQAATDPLTRLANHRAFHERLREELSRALRHGRPLALALLDVDHFKAINDSLGHERGDVDGGDGRADALDGGQGLRLVGLGHEQRELVAAQAGEDVLGARDVAQRGPAHADGKHALHRRVEEHIICDTVG